MTENAAELGKLLKEDLQKIQEKHSDRIGFLTCEGLVAGMQIVKPNTKEADQITAYKINEGCFQKGLLMFAPVGIGGRCVKIAPPLTITKEALDEGLKVLDEVCDEVL